MAFWIQDAWIEAFHPPPPHTRVSSIYVCRFLGQGEGGGQRELRVQGERRLDGEGAA